MSYALSRPGDCHWRLIIVGIGPEDVYLGTRGSLEAPDGASVMADEVANLYDQEKMTLELKKS